MKFDTSTHVAMLLVVGFCQSQDGQRRMFDGYVWKVVEYIVKWAKGFMRKQQQQNDQEIPQSQTADNPVAPRGRAAQPSRDTRKTN